MGEERTQSPSPRRRAHILDGAAAGAVVAWLGFGAPAMAQTVPNGPAGDDAYFDRAVQVWKVTGYCVLCHDWTGMGARVEAEEDRGLNANAPKLVDIKLSKAEIEEAIRCGRPGSIMPWHDASAWNARPCYGMMRAEIGSKLPDPPRVRPLTEQKIQDVMRYVDEIMRTGGLNTKERCARYWGSPDARQCVGLP